MVNVLMYDAISASNCQGIFVVDNVGSLVEKCGTVALNVKFVLKF